MTATTTNNAPTSISNRSMTAWVVRRALLGLLILTVTIGGSAWLLHASIEPTADLPDAVLPSHKV